MVYAESLAFFGGLIHGGGLYSGVGAYIRNHFFVWSFSHRLFLSQERRMKKDKKNNALAAKCYFTT